VRRDGGGVQRRSATNGPPCKVFLSRNGDGECDGSARSAGLTLVEIAMSFCKGMSRKGRAVGGQRNEAVGQNRRGHLTNENSSLQSNQYQPPAHIQDRADDAIVLQNRPGQLTNDNILPFQSNEHECKKNLSCREVLSVVHFDDVPIR
jgi:hypothetical protein